MRTAGDDIDITVRVRKANLPALLSGVELGLDALSASIIKLRLEQIEEGIYSIFVEANSIVEQTTPEPVDSRQLGVES